MARNSYSQPIYSYEATTVQEKCCLDKKEVKRDYYLQKNIGYKENRTPGNRFEET